MLDSSDVIFFDPDNGMEVRSKPKGRKDSSKSLYWDEVRQVAARDRSLIVFQHFARVKREPFIAELRQRFMRETGASWVGVLRTSNVAYFVVPAFAHRRALRDACYAVMRRWQPHVWLV